jgi:hypothetical protein
VTRYRGVTCEVALGTRTRYREDICEMALGAWTRYRGDICEIALGAWTRYLDCQRCWHRPRRRTIECPTVHQFVSVTPVLYTQFTGVSCLISERLF